MPAKRTPEEILVELEHDEFDGACERVAMLSDRELDRELTQAGVDPARFRAGGRAAFDRVLRDRAPRATRRERTQSGLHIVSWRMAGAAAAASVALALGLAVPTLRGHLADRFPSGQTTKPVASRVEDAAAVLRLKQDAGAGRDGTSAKELE